jgi:hypothetical protein
LCTSISKAGWNFAGVVGKFGMVCGCLDGAQGAGMGHGDSGQLPVDLIEAPAIVQIVIENLDLMSGETSAQAAAVLPALMFAVGANAHGSLAIR